MPVKGKPRSFHKKFKFIVECDGIAVAAFTKAGPLEVELAVVEQHEGGSLTANKSPGRAKFSDCTLERGVTDDLDLWNWLKEVADIAANSGEVDDEYKRTLDIVQLDRDNTSLKRYRLFEAWPSKFTAGDWDNDADENTVEKATLTYRYFDIIKS